MFALAADEGTDYFEKHIRPVLATRCYGCHSSKLKAAQGDFYADTKDGLLRGGKSGAPGVVPGKPEESLVVKAIQHAHKDLKMPPGKPLPREQVDAFIEWVKMGAPDPRTGSAPIVEKAAYDWDAERRHWAYQPLKRLEPPVVTAPEWSRTAVDRFIKSKLDDKGLVPLQRASRRALLRRVTYDLTGMPPTPEEVDAFVADKSSRALETVVDRLLTSPRYGEHWGRHWLDVVRYADTAGDASDYPVPEMYRYRNYVIRAFQEDKPFDQFVREQIAGDLMKHKDDEDRAEKLIATGYLGASRRFGQTDREFYLTVDDTIENMGKALLGLTTGCARCHDHKFDPIPTKDYYAIAGVLNSTKYPFPGLEHHQYLDGFAALKAADQERLDKMQAQMVEAFRTVKKGGKEDKLKFLEASVELSKLRQTWPDIPMIYAVRDDKPQNARVMVKGDPKTLGPEAPRGFLQILGGQKIPADHTGSGRDLLANWITDPKNPLTARVMVNRVWLWHFGRGLVNSPNDFGKRGEAPSHPELLDYLASSFIDSGWSIKKLHREIVLSRTYATASGHHEANALKDVKNEYYWRFDRRRLSAEEIRDSILAATGELDTTPAGPHAFGPRATYTLTQHNPFVADFQKLANKKRSVYQLQQRFRPNPYLELFDGADANNSTPVRVANNSALQALYMMNNSFVEEQAGALAARVAVSEETSANRIRLAFRLLYGRTPSAAEHRMALDFLARDKPLLTSDMPVDARTRAAWTGLMRVLLSSNEFFYVD
ncbi:MAG TPA: PSD1 and planctomycete cytochrome C domain-containing protein [Bryobacteraceae bacterium]|nr:PSD1 and planctomycete cytochrome C domain-containing protein [Bryobacteraceae bacterium]